MSQPRRAFLAVCTVAFALASCGDKEINADRAADTVANTVKEKTGFDAKDVRCPSGVKAEVNGTFECTFTGPEGPYVANVRIISIDGDDAQFQIDTKRASS